MAAHLYQDKKQKQQRRSNENKHEDQTDKITNLDFIGQNMS